MSHGAAPFECRLKLAARLLKRRQIRNSRPCAIATANLLRRVVSSTRAPDPNKLIERVQSVGRRLVAAQPRELVVGNIVRRVLGLIREEAEDDRGEGDYSGISSEAGLDSRPQTPRNPEAGTDSPSRAPSTTITSLSPLRHGGLGSQEQNMSNGAFDGEERAPNDPSPIRPPLLTSHTSFAPGSGAPAITSMFSILSHPGIASSQTHSPAGSPSGRGSLTPNAIAALNSAKDLRAEVIDGIGEIIDELDQVDDQIAGYALEHIHENEIIMTYTSSVTVQKFLLRAAAKRKFTVIHAEAYPNNHHATHATVTGAIDTTGDQMAHDAFQKPLTVAGITVVLISDSAVFALMSRVNKVILGTHAVLGNGSLVAAAGAMTIAKAAKVHQTPVVVLSGVYKLSPVYPFDPESLIEYGDPNKVLPYEDGEMVDSVEVENPLFDYVPAEFVDLYITNLGGHAPSYLYRIVADHYRKEDFIF